jgi:acyl-coenzyme A thioesterase PaaI-like protein
MADVVAGRLAALSTAPRLAVTVDLRWVELREPPSGRIIAVARLLKAGRTTIVTEVTFQAVDPDEPHQGPFAMAVATFVASARPVDVLPTVPAERIPIAGNGFPTLEMAVLERIGLRELDGGSTETPLTHQNVNSGGALQGGAVTLVAEGTAAAAATAVSGRRCRVVDMDVRYLSALREGPVIGVPVPLATTNEGSTLWRVTLSDAGRPDRPGALAMARCRPLTT